MTLFLPPGHTILFSSTGRQFSLIFLKPPRKEIPPLPLLLEKLYLWSDLCVFLLFPLVLKARKE